MLETILKLVELIKAEFLSVINKTWEVWSEWLVEITTLRGFLKQAAPSLKYPGLVVGAENMIDIPFKTLDVWTNGLGALPAVVAASMLVDEFEVDPVLKQRVMTVESAAKMPMKVMLDYGLRNFTEGPPTQWKLYQWWEGIRKKLEFFAQRSRSSFFKIFIPGLVGRVFAVANLVITLLTMFGVIHCMWNYSQAMKKGSAATIFSAQLSNRNKRLKQKSKIYRRVGGVRP